jgi:hypothetical protein
MREEILQMTNVAHPECLAHFKEHGGQLITKNYAANDAQDIGGMPLEPKEDKNGICIQTYSNPLPQYGYGIYFQDEANRVTDPQLKTMQLSLWVDRGVNGNYLGPGYLQILAGNTFDDAQYKTAKRDDNAHTDRYVIIHLRPTFEEVMEYLQAAYPTHPMTKFLRENKSFISLFNSNNTGFSPRTLDFYMNETDSIIGSVMTNSENAELVEMITHAYFKNEASLFLKFLHDKVDVNYKRIKENPELAERIKKHDTALMNTLLIQAQDDLLDLVKTKSVSSHDIAVLKLVLEKFTKEVQQLFIEWIVSSQSKHNVRISPIIEAVDSKFFLIFKGLEQTISRSTRAV